MLLMTKDFIMAFPDKPVAAAVRMGFKKIFVNIKLSPNCHMKDAKGFISGNVLNRGPMIHCARSNRYRGGNG
jgi:hypothetical protein